MFCKRLNTSQVIWKKLFILINLIISWKLDLVIVKILNVFDLKHLSVTKKLKQDIYGGDMLFFCALIVQSRHPDNVLPCLLYLNEPDDSLSAGIRPLWCDLKDSDVG